MYKVLIRPVLTYTSETWTLSKTNERQLSLFKRKVLCCIFGAKQEKGIWQKRYNYEVYEKLNEPNIVNCIKVKRLAWAGHLVRMNNERTIKKIFNAKPDRVRSVGRPKLRWEDGVDQDMRISEVKNWKRVALNRDEWTKLLKKARAHHGLSSQWWWCKGTLKMVPERCFNIQFPPEKKSNFNTDFLVCKTITSSAWVLKNPITFDHKSPVLLQQITANSRNFQWSVHKIYIFLEARTAWRE